MISIPSENNIFRVFILEEIICPKHQRDSCQQDLEKPITRAQLLIGSLIFFIIHLYIMDIFKHITTLKENYNKYIHPLDSTTNISLYLLITHLFANPSLYSLTNTSYIFDKFQLQIFIYMP